MPDILCPGYSYKDWNANRLKPWGRIFAQVYIIEETPASMGFFIVTMDHGLHVYVVCYCVEWAEIAVKLDREMAAVYARWRWLDQKVRDVAY